MRNCLLALAASATLTSASAAVEPLEVSPYRYAVDNRTDFAGRLLDSHNRERRRLGIAPLRWNPALAAHAKAWAETLARRGAFEHSSNAARPGEGENLFTGTASAYSLEEMIGGFVDERRDFKPGTFPNISRSGRWENVGHYTQLIWRGTTDVGCGIATARGRDYLTCRYGPAGNVVGQRVP